MKGSTWLIYGLLFSALGAAGWTCLDGLFHAQLREAEARVRAAESAARQRWLVEATEQDAAVHRRRMEVQEDVRASVEKALGGPLAVVAKNPELNLTELLRRLAEHVAPPEAKVSVWSERFVEFHLAIDLPSEATLWEIAGWTRTLVPFVAKYLHRLQFRFQGETIAELDRSLIEANGDWSTLALAEIVTALSSLTSTNGAASPEAGDSAAEAGSPRARFDEPLRDPGAQRLREAEEKFFALLAERQASLPTVFKQMDDLTHLSSIRTKEDLRARRDDWRRLDNQLASVEQFFSDPGAVFRTMLEKAGADPVYARASLRGLEQKQASRETRDAVFRAGSEYANAVASLLEAMQQRWGEWDASVSQGQLSFSTTRAQHSYESAVAEIGRTGEALNQALRIWGRPPASARP